MKWLFRGRASKRWRTTLQKVSAAAGMPTPPPPRAQPRELLDDLGVGVSQTQGPSTLTLLSLERYREGFIIQFRLLRERHHRRQLFMPQLALSIVDGRATRYELLPQGGGGGGRLDGLMEWRYHRARSAPEQRRRRGHTAPLPASHHHRRPPSGRTQSRARIHGPSRDLAPRRD